MLTTESSIKQILKTRLVDERENRLRVFHECKHPEYAETEVWEGITETDNYYISSFGRVLRQNKSNGQRRILTDTDTYRNTGKIMVNGKFIRPHIYVAKYFGAMGNGDKVIHINGDKYDNKIDNLRFASKKEASCAPLISREYTSQVPLCQFTPNGLFIKLWRDISEIIAATGFRPGDVLSCAEGRVLTAYGCVWSFATDAPEYKRFPQVAEKVAALKEWLVTGIHSGGYILFPTVGEASQISGVSEYDIIRSCLLSEKIGEWSFINNGINSLHKEENNYE